MTRRADSSDGGAIAAISNHYVLSTVVTFQEQPVSTKRRTSSSISGSMLAIGRRRDRGGLIRQFAFRRVGRNAAGSRSNLTVQTHAFHALWFRAGG